MNFRLVRLSSALAAILLATQLVATPVRADYLDGDWQQLMSPQAPAGAIPTRAYSSMVMDSARDRLILFGGSPGPMRDIWTLSMAPGSTWQRMIVNGTQPSARFGHCAIYDPVGDRMLVFGGNSNGPKNDLWILTLSGVPRWTSIIASGLPPLPVQDASAVYDPIQHRMVIYGGLRLDGWCSSETWSLSLANPLAWSRLDVFGTEPPVRAAAQCVLDQDQNRLVVFGGWDGNLNLNDTWTLSLEPGGYWTRLTSTQVPSPRRAGAAIFDPSAHRLVMYGGGPAPNANGECWQLTLDGASEWSELSPSGQTPGSRFGASAIYDPQRARMIFFGGLGASYCSDTRALSLGDAPTWSELVEGGVVGAMELSPRRESSAIYNPGSHEMLLFGGANGTRDFNDAWRLDLDAPSPSWSPMLTSGPFPAERHGQRAAWDSSRERLFVVGGFHGGYGNDVWMLSMNPTPTWQEVFPSGQPPAGRMVFGLGYDPVRDRLIMVGGHSGAGPFAFRNDVWQLPLSGPSALSWSLISVAGAPLSPRWIYGMQYDPLRDRFLIVGGTVLGGFANDVWALNLSGAPTWAPLATNTPRPAARGDHAVVYDSINDRLVTYGGYNGTFLSDVWALTLSAAPTWSQLAPGGSGPGAAGDVASSFDPVAGRMLVFGGWNGSSMLANTWALAWGSPPTPTEASLIESHVQPDRVRLAWNVRDAASVQAQVERRADGVDWSALGTPVVEGGEILRFEDVDVVPGARYGYRLRLRANGEETLTSETEIEVPRRATLALAGARPNPTQGGPLRVSFSLSHAGDGRLELLDVSGRRVASRSLDGLEPGTHHVVFSEASGAEPGVYLLRLVTSERTLTAKALVTR